MCMHWTQLRSIQNRNMSMSYMCQQLQQHYQMNIRRHSNLALCNDAITIIKPRQSDLCPQTTPDYIL
ncbi:hypothetical protein EUGRSUZ_D00974 [Eucalyptus grandis]|uniref:Uncharacterized protein n=2 Tax=Eucalyptus grandis TaxID=71139 RepID=A0ACC3L5E1_EUCGR|nr:hypothetical protein EUGRSUZ_D00974 [Eucalyptus grandis]